MAIMRQILLCVSRAHKPQIDTTLINYISLPLIHLPLVLQSGDFKLRQKASKIPARVCYLSSALLCNRGTVRMAYLNTYTC